MNNTPEMETVVSEATEPASEKKTENTTEPIHSVPPTGQPYYQPIPPQDPANSVVGTGAFFGLELLLNLPIVGFIAAIIISFVPQNHNLKHYARAKLIWNLISLLLTVLLIVGLIALSNAITDYFEDKLGLDAAEQETIEELFGQMEDLTEIAGIVEQIGGMEGIGEIIEQVGGAEGLGEILEQVGGMENAEDFSELAEQFREIENLGKIIAEVEEIENIDEIIEEIGGIDRIADVDSIDDIRGIINEIDDPEVKRQLTEILRENGGY